MKTVTIARLKDHLSEYLQEVNRGEEIIIRNRKKPVAMIIRFPGKDDSEEQQLVAEGKLRVPLSEMNSNFWKEFWKVPGAKVALKKAAESVVKTRDENK